MSTEDSLCAIRSLRKALIIGLQSLSEIERLEDRWGVHVEIAKEIIPDDLRPIHPTGTAAEAGTFADALAYLDHIETDVAEGKIALA